MNTDQTSNQESYIVTEMSKHTTERSHCKTLRRQFPFMWKLCLTYGLCYLLFAYQNSNGIGSGIFAAISAIFLLAIAKRLKKHPIQEEALSVHISAESIFYYTAATFISFGNCITDSVFFLFFNHVGSFLLFSIASIKLFYHDKQWDFGKYTCILFTFWMQILEALPVPFRDFGAHRRATKQKMPESVRYIIIGVLCGLPILLVTTLLLVSADQIFSNVLESIFDFDALANWFFGSFLENICILPFCFLFYTLLLYLLFAALCNGGLKEEVRAPKKHGTLIAITMFTMIDIVYVLFCVIQILFLFIGIMPDMDYEYADYARQGFFELLFVALINFFLVLFCNKHFTKNAILKIAMTITCICTYIMIASSAYRMLMYIDVCHLTFLRIFVLWFLAMLCFFMAGSLISIYKENWNSFRYCLFVLTCFYTALALANVDGQIAKYNVAQFEKDIPEAALTYGTYLKEHPNTPPTSYIYTQLDAVGVPALSNYLPSDYAQSKAYATVLYDLRERYGDALKKHNLQEIDNYLCTEDHFYFREPSLSSYEYMDYVLSPEATIYDKEISTSIFTWKHFNFIEYTCYKLCD